MNSKTHNRRFVVIGGVTAGMSAASVVKRSDPDAEVLIFEKGQFISYDTCSIPYFIGDVIDDHRRLIELTPEQAKQNFQIDVWTQHEAMAIYPDKQSVVVLDRNTGEEKTVHYDALLLATGGVPITPPVPGIDLPNIFQVRTLSDSLHLKQYITKYAPRKATIIGGGYLGLEMAEACSRLDMDVTILEKFGNIMGTMGSDVTHLIEQHLWEQGVHLFKEVSLDSFEAIDRKCGAVVVGGQRLDTDLVMIAIGVRPEIALARGAGIEIGDTGAIAVNSSLQTSIENIYAAGDCTEVTHLVSGTKMYLPLGATACKQGCIAGENIVQPGSHEFKGVVGTTVTKVFDLQVARTGVSAMDAKRLGFDPAISTITADSRDRNYPGSQTITITLIADKTSKQLLGAEMVGKEGVAKRIDVFAAALDNQMTAQALTHLDLSYAPPYSPPWDPILVAANMASKKLS